MYGRDVGIEWDRGREGDSRVRECKGIEGEGRGGWGGWSDRVERGRGRGGCS